MLATFKNITCFVFDVDGVLTNGNVIVMPNGALVRTMNIKDGYALQLAIKKGYKVWIISGGKSEEVRTRLENLGVTAVYLGITNKLEKLKEVCLLEEVDLKDILYMGDDMPDYEVLQAVGLPTCPNDAVVDIKQICTYTAIAKGGEGCAREVIEKTLKLNGHWDLSDHIPAQ